ncbi:PREDICTED: proprotein convertase subtilisin/kexin type 4 [Nanorana parkeri]|uniref:proprotein convertase subtilisin/kexin type 4 n=1 Tax=Nanorana parkeri TaxID=125878 RepID=UPI000853F827|nr:PREDICTED: proprotein convertase subtilisin/kexin type 4 [Nanorana parkeri]
MRCLLALRVYTNSWAVQVDGGPEEVEKIAGKLGFISLGQVILGSDLYHLQHRGVLRKSLTPHRSRHIRLKKEPKVQWLEQQTLKKRTKRHSVVPTDPLFHKQWYMNNDISPDLNVITAWRHGFSGQGVVVTDSKASFDFNNNDPDPQPRYTSSNENSHGTRCAGVVAAVANNDICGAGVAYNARIGGIRMLDGSITDVIEARSLSLNPQHIHIYSASWGPEDDGMTVEGPGILAMEAFYRGIVHGRGGLGSIFVWASGNGGLHYDDCNCDGYSNSIYTLSVVSTTENGEVPWYSEGCSSILTTTFSSGKKKDRKIITTDLRKRCTEHHTGTSASAPLAAGIIALALEANPALTWRDVQHIVVRASSPTHLVSDDWKVNGVGRKVSRHYGYGLLDAGQLVDLAQKWEMTRPQRRCEVNIVNSPQKLSSGLTVNRYVIACAGSPSYILSLEHVQAQISLGYTRRGDLEIFLTSPMGTRSVLVSRRPYDMSSAGYRKWTFMSTHSWDENPRGLWTLELVNKGNDWNNGFLNSFTLILYGTDERIMARKISEPVLRDCVTRGLNGTCLECEMPFYALGHLCITYCPSNYFKTLQPVRTEKLSVILRTARACAPCHHSCYTCRGPSANNCTACPLYSSYNEREHLCSQSSYPRINLRPRKSSESLNVAMIVMLLGGIVLLVCLVSLLWICSRLLVHKFSLPNMPHNPGLEMYNLHSEDDEAAVPRRI